MKIKFSIVMCSAICIAFLGLSNLINAQQLTTTVGNGTASSASFLGWPFYVVERSTWTETLLTPADLAGALPGTIPAGSTIHSLALNVLTVGANRSFGNFQIYIANTTLTALPSYRNGGHAAKPGVENPSGYQLVFQNDNYWFPQLTGWVTFNFATPFVYTGGNLVIMAGKVYRNTRNNVIWQFNSGC